MRTIEQLRVLILFPLLFMFIACPETDLAEIRARKGYNLLSIDLSSALNEPFTTAFNEANKLGMDFYRVSIYWSQLEIKVIDDPGHPENFRYELADPEHIITDMEDFYLAQGRKVYLTIAGPINITIRNMPEDIYNLNLNSPSVKDRYKALLAYIFSNPDKEIYKNLLGINLSNEVDIYYATWPLETITDFKAFFIEMRDYLKALVPGVKVSFTSTLEGVTAFMKDKMFDLYTNETDFLSLDYYPLNDDYTVRDPSVITDDFNRLFTLYTQDVYFQECGYPTGSYCNSNEELQARFFEELFKAYDQNSSQIKAMSITSFTDTSLEYATMMVEHLDLNDPALIDSTADFFRTVGLRNYETGAGKTALARFKQLIAARGW